MKQKYMVSKSLLLPNPAITHKVPPHSNQASPSRIVATGAFLSPAFVPSTNAQCQVHPSNQALHCQVTNQRHLGSETKCTLRNILLWGTGSRNGSVKISHRIDSVFALRVY